MSSNSTRARCPGDRLRGVRAARLGLPARHDARGRTAVHVRGARGDGARCGRRASASAARGGAGSWSRSGVEAPPGVADRGRSRTWSTPSRRRSSSSRSGSPGYYGSTPARDARARRAALAEAAQGAAVRGRGARAPGRGRARGADRLAARGARASSRRSTAAAARSCCTARPAAARPRSTSRRARPPSSAAAARSCSCPRSP